MTRRRKAGGDKQFLLFPPKGGASLGGSRDFSDPQDVGFFTVDPGGGTPANFGANCVLLAYGDLKQSRRSKRPYEFRRGSVLGVTGRTEDNRPVLTDEPELFFIETPSSGRQPYDLNKLSGGGEIFTPLIIAGGYHGDDDEDGAGRMNYFHVPERSALDGVRAFSLSGSVSLGNYLNVHQRRYDALVVTPPCTFLFAHEVGTGGDFPFAESYACRFLWFEVVQDSKGSRRWFGVQPGRQTLLLPKLGYQKLLAATKSYTDDDDGELKTPTTNGQPSDSSQVTDTSAAGAS